MHKLKASLAASMLATALFAVSGFASASSTLIGAGKTFMLGGSQCQSVMIEGVNTGKVDVEVLLLTDGVERRVATVAPGKRFSLELPAGNTALFRNRASRTAGLDLELTDAVSTLSMRYENDDDGL